MTIIDFFLKQNLPIDANVGAEAINEPLRSALAISVIYTMAGLVPRAVKKNNIDQDSCQYEFIIITKKLM